MIRDIAKISDLPAETVEEYRKGGWTDEEIVENLNDAINFLNRYLRRIGGEPGAIPARFVLSDCCR